MMRPAEDGNLPGEPERDPAPTVTARQHLGLMLKVGVIGFGGGSALIPVMEKEIVGPGRLSENEFVQDTVIANITPGALPVKLAALAGVRFGRSRTALAGAFAVAIPGAVGTVAFLALFAQLGPGAIRSVEFASLGITAFIIYLLAHYVGKVLLPNGKVQRSAVIIAALAFLASGAGDAIELAGVMVGLSFELRPPELTALGLVLVSLAAISVASMIQYFSARRSPRSDAAPGANRTGPPPGNGAAAAVRTVLLFSSLAGLAVAAGLLIPGSGLVGFQALVLTSTLTSFGGGEAYVGVADGFFVASGLIESTVFYGQIVPVANALPGPILVKVAAGTAFVLGGSLGWVFAAVAFILTVASCSAVAVGVLSGYDRARNSLLIRNISTFILPVICGLLASTALSMLLSNVRIAGEAGVPGLITVPVSVLLAAAVPTIRRRVRIPDIALIVIFAGLTLLGLTLAA
ncbi:chromate transporter [Pseudoclavibacter sp. RFBB5]|uniref:chromate transporter n=1 Tax=Pseudoclavibacter sp. RFBB5 TaxID=2080574 RepID=UPI0015E20CC6|nr:chromate transporter [Pseudoclavibacter sp. RFBB5]